MCSRMSRTLLICNNEIKRTTDLCDDQQGSQYVCLCVY